MDEETKETEQESPETVSDESIGTEAEDLAEDSSPTESDEQTEEVI